MIVFSVVALLAAIFMPGIISKLPNTKVTCAVLAVAAGVTLYLGWAAGSDGMRNLLIAVSGVCLGGLLPTIMSMPAFLPEIGPAKIGAAGGLISTVMMAGAFLIPSYVITPIAGGINNTAFLVAAGCACLLALLFAILPNVSVRKG